MRKLRPSEEFLTNFKVVVCCAVLGLSVFLAPVTFAQDVSDYLLDANEFYTNYLITKDKELLDKAYLNYYKANELVPTASGYLGMGMVFLEKQMRAKAKNYLYKAYSIDENDATVNYYLAKFSYENEEYLRALTFFKKAYANGLANNYDVNEKIATIYEKVGDTEKAREFYNSALKLNPESDFCINRLNTINELENNINKYIVD